MSRTGLPRTAALLALAPILLTVAGAAPADRPAPKVVPKFAAVAETSLLMDGLNEANYRGLEKMLKQKPTDADSWTYARGQALLIAETGNLLLLRPPRNAGQDAWFRDAMDLRDAAADLAHKAGDRDYDGSVAGMKIVAAACNKCHQTFRVATQVGGEGSERREPAIRLGRRGAVRRRPRRSFPQGTASAAADVRSGAWRCAGRFSAAVPSFGR